LQQHYYYYYYVDDDVVVVVVVVVVPLSSKQSAFVFLRGAYVTSPRSVALPATALQLRVFCKCADTSRNSGLSTNNLN
jgi:hypothetical protein